MLSTTFQGGDIVEIGSISQYMTHDQQLEPGTHLFFSLRFTAQSKIDNNISQLSYEEEWLQSRLRNVESKNIAWLLIPKLNQEHAYWSKMLTALQTLKQKQFGLKQWSHDTLQSFFYLPSTIQLLNDIARESLITPKVAFDRNCVKDIYTDRLTQEIVVRLQGIIQPTQDLIATNIRHFNIIFGLIRSFRTLTGGILTHPNDDTFQCLFLTTRDCLYNIFDADTSIYRVALIEPDAYIYKVLETEEKEEFDGGSEQMVHELLLRIPYSQALVSFNDSMESSRILGDGQSILLTLPNKDDLLWNRHVMIGKRIYEFRTRDTVFQMLVHPINQNPWALTDRRVYLMDERKSIKRLDNTIENPYDYYYGVTQQDEPFGSIKQSLKLGSFYGYDILQTGSTVSIPINVIRDTIVRDTDGIEKEISIRDKVREMMNEVSTLKGDVRWWIDDNDGNRQYVEETALVKMFERLSLVTDMVTGALSFYKVRLIEERSLL